MTTYKIVNNSRLSAADAFHRICSLVDEPMFNTIIYVSRLDGKHNIPLSTAYKDCKIVVRTTVSGTVVFTISDHDGLNL